MAKSKAAALDLIKFTKRRLGLMDEGTPAFPDYSRHFSQDWTQWTRAREAAEGAPYCIAVSLGAHQKFVALSVMLAVALTLRGKRVFFLLCDKNLEACEYYTHQIMAQHSEQFETEGISPDACGYCYMPALESLKTLELPILTFSEVLQPGDVERLAEMLQSIPAQEKPTYTIGSANIGEEAMATLRRIYSRSDVSVEPHWQLGFERCFAAALRSHLVATRVLEQLQPQGYIGHHGIYVPQGILSAVFRDQGKTVVNYTISYRKNTLIFSNDHSYHHTMLRKDKDRWTHLVLDEPRRQKLHTYLNDRRSSRADWLLTFQDPDRDLAQSVIDQKPGYSRVVTLLTNVIWDAQLFYPSNAFPTMREWLVETIEFFGKKTDTHLIIRVHPGEVRGTLRTRERVGDIIREDVPELPGNVTVVEAEHSVNTYSLVDLSDYVIVYGTKTAIEIAAKGKAVVIAGEAWARNKGFTFDASSPEDYFEMLNHPETLKMSEESIRDAEKYAYYFFMSRMVEINCLETLPDATKSLRITAEGLSPLAPEGDPGLDVICRGIIEGTEFELDPLGNP